MSCDPKKVAGRKLFDDFIIPNITPGQLDQFVQSIAGNVYHKLLEISSMTFLSEKDRKNALSAMHNKVMEEHRIWIQDRVDAYKKLTHADPKVTAQIEGIVSHFESYLNDWSKVDKLVNEYFNTLTGISEIDSILNELDDVNAVQERSNFEDDYTFLMDQRKGSSARMKMLFGFIPKGKTYIDGINGFQSKSEDKNNTYYSIDEVFNTVTEILASSNDELVDFTWEAIEAKLKSAIESFNNVKINTDKANYVSKILEILNNQPQYVKNEFMVVMLKHFTPMKMVMISDNTIKMIDANAYSIVKNLKRKWKENLKAFNILLDEDGYFKQDKIDELSNKITEAINSDDLAPVVDVFNSIGVNLSLEAWEYIRMFGLEHGNKSLTWKVITGRSVKTSLLKILDVNLKDAINEKYNIDDVDILSDSIFNSLAQVQAKLDNSEYSHSHRVGGKTVFSYTNFKYSIQRILKLKFNENLRKELKSNAYSKSALWLNLFESEEFKNRFGYSYVSLEAMRKEHSKSSDKGLEHLSSIDHEIYKTGIYFNQGSKYNNGTRNANYMYFTMSDKKTQMMIHSYAFDIENGVMNTVKVIDGLEVITPVDVYDFLVDIMVQPEVDRILDSFNQDYNIAGYKPNMFWNIPELNYELIDDVEVRNALYGEDGSKSIATMLTDPNTRKIVREIVKKRVDTLIDNKVQDWSDSGIGLVEDEFKFIDERVVQKFLNKVDKENPNRLKEVNRLLAEDYIVNGLIANTNISQLLTGDPALAYKEVKGNFKDAREKIIATLYSTLDNLGKRLAMDNAPRYVGAWSNKKYRQGFLKDAEMVSIDIQNLTRKLDGVAITDDELKQFHEGDKDVKNKILTKFPVSAPYFKIESTDAQEFTTLQEHLDVMYAHGKINDKQYNSFKDKKEFSKEELGVIMQPIKPVYTGHIRSEGIDRRIYIKSSSFPLLPQLTKGLEIDKLRVAMERDNVNRVAFSTAVKVGNVVEPGTIYDSEGNVSDVKFDDTNSLILDRDDFGLQLDVPYDPEKSYVNTGTQERKLLFNNILGVSGFKYKGVSYTGTELREKYLDKWNEAYEDSRTELLESLGGDLNNINYKELLKVALKEAKSRGYSINDVIGIQPILDENGEFLDFRAPLWMLPSSTRIEALFTSIVENNVLKKLFNGKSYVLGTQEGFKKNVKTLDEVSEDIKSGITYTNNWKGELGPNDVLIPWKFKFDIDKVTTNGAIDISKLPSELLKIFGYRIPTQGFNSMRSLNVVGFLPKESGDLLIASRDLVVQMGSDFDVDKLYTYMYNLQPIFNKSEEEGIQYDKLKDKTLLKDLEDFIEYINSSDLSDELKTKSIEVINSIPEKDRIKLVKATFGKLKDGFGTIKPGTAEFNALKHVKRLLSEYRGEVQAEMSVLETQFKQITSVTKLNDPENNKWKTIQNDILEMHFAILDNESPSLQYQLHKPLEYGDLGTLASEVEKKRSDSTQILPSILSPDYQKSKYLNARAGKIGIGSFSLDSVFASVIQGLNLIVNPSMFDEFKIFGVEANTNISSIFTNKTTDKLFRIYNEESTTKSFDKWIEDLNIDTLINAGKIKITDIKFKTDVIAAYQSASVDDERQQILAKLNIQSETFDTIRALAYLGFDEQQIQGIVSQDIMFELVNKLRQRTSLAEGFSRNVHDEVLGELIIEAATRAGLTIEEGSDPITALDGIFEDIQDYSILTKNNLYSKIGDPELNSTPLSGLIDLHVLQIYRSTRDLGLYIRKLQTTINTDSKGLEQSLITTSLKEIAVSELVSRPEEQRRIINEEKIIGEFDEEGKLVKPLTIGGMAFSSGLVLANDIFLRGKGKQFFPYGSKVLSNIFDEITQFMPNFSSFSISKKTEIYNKIFKDFKSFLYSSTNAGLSSDPHTSRQLLHTRNKVRPNLAQIINGINRGFITHNGVRIDVDGSVKNNPFIRRLETNFQANNYSTIETNAAAAVNLDERNIHIAASFLVSNPTVLYTQDTFQYTTKDLVDDLIESAFLTGGIQEARQYLKYLPLEYVLETGGFGEYLRGIEFTFGNQNIGDRLNGLYRFTRQYMQHNPSDAFVADISDIKFNNAVNPDKPNWQVVLSEDNSNIGLSNFQSEEYPRFLSIRIPSKFVKQNKEGESFVPEVGFVLYEARLDSDNKPTNNYVRIPTAGSKNISEYTADEDLAKSILPGNNKGITVLEEASAPPRSIQPEQVNVVPEVEHTTNDMLNFIRENSNNVEFQELAEELINALEKLGLNPSLNVINDKDFVYRGEFSSIVSGESPTYLSFSDSITVNIFRSNTRSLFEQTFLHEALHAVSVHVIEVYLQDPDSLSPVLKHHFDRLEEIRNRILSEITSNSMQSLGVDAVNKGGKLLEAIISGNIRNQHDDIQKYAKEILNLNDDQIKFLGSNEFLKQLYNLKNLKEFIVAIKIESSFEKFIDSVDPTFFDKIKNILKDIINYILGTTPSQHLRRVVNEIIDLSSDVEVATKDKAVIKNVEYQFAFNQGGRLLYVIDNMDGAVIADLLVRKEIYQLYLHQKNNPPKPDDLDPNTIPPPEIEEEPPVEVLEDGTSIDPTAEWTLVGDKKTIKFKLQNGNYEDVQATSIVIKGFEHLNLAFYDDRYGYAPFDKGYKIVDVDTGTTLAYAEIMPFFGEQDGMGDLIKSLKENDIDSLLEGAIKIKPDTQFTEGGKVVNKKVVPEGSSATNPVAITIDGVDYLMNDDQTRAYHSIAKFIADNLDKPSTSGNKRFVDNSNKRFDNVIPNKMWDKMFGLLGKAGTGKTTIIKRIIEDINADPKKFGLDWRLNISYVGPTHTSTTVLAESLNLDSEGTKDVPTFASFVAKYPDGKGDFKLMEDAKYIQQLKFQRRNPISSLDVIVLDEVSMYDVNFIKDLVSRIDLEIKEGYGHKYPVMIMMGDYRQLPPVLKKSIPYNEGVVSATVLKEKYIEMTQVMRTKNTDMYEIFDSVADQIDDHREQFNFSEKYEKFDWNKYDAVSNKSTNDILVVPEREIDLIVDMYVEELLNTDDPYEMFWVHYNNSIHPNTVVLFDKIRKKYLERLGVEYTNELVKGDYVEFGYKLPLVTGRGTYKGKNIEPGTIKPNARIKILDILDDGKQVEIGQVFTQFDRLPFSSIKVPTVTLVFKNRQGNVRAITLPKDKIFDSATYNASIKSSVVTIKGQQYSVPYSKAPDLLSNVNLFNKGTNYAVNEKGENDSILIHSYIGSSHTAQGNSIKKVIVGDYNIRKNLGPENQIDIEKSLYTALTRTSSKLIIIKPDYVKITNNVTDFSLNKESTPGTSISQPKVPRESIASKTLKAHLNRGITTLWVDYESKSSGRRVRKLENIKLLPGMEGKFFALQEGEEREFNIDRIHNIYDKNPQPTLTNETNTTAPVQQDDRAKIMQAARNARIPQNLKHGVDVYGTKQYVREDILTELNLPAGRIATSMDLILAGFRTRTTRSADEYKKYGEPQVGDYIFQEGATSDGVKKVQLTKVTAVYGQEDSRWVDNWNKEGWTNEGLDNIKRFREGAKVIEFEVVRKGTEDGAMYFKEEKALYEYHLRLWNENKGNFYSNNINGAEATYERQVKIHGEDFVRRPKKLPNGSYRIYVLKPKYTDRNRVTVGEKIQKWVDSLSEDQYRSEMLLAEQQEREERTIRIIPREQSTGHIYDLLKKLRGSKYSAIEVIRGWLVSNGIIDIHNNVLNIEEFNKFNKALSIYVKAMFNIRMGDLFTIQETDIGSSIVTRIVPNIEIFKILDSINGKRTPDQQQSMNYSPAFSTETTPTVDYKEIKRLLNTPGLVKYEDIAKQFNELWLKRQNTITQLSIDISDIENKLASLPNTDPSRTSLQGEKSKLFETRRKTAEEANKLLGELHSMTQAVTYEEVLFQGSKQSDRIARILNQENISDEELVYVNRMIDIWREALVLDSPGTIFTQEEIESTAVEDDLLYLKRSFDNHQRNYDKISRGKIEEFINEQLNTVLTEEEILESIKDSSVLAAWVRDIGKFNPVQLQAMSKLMAKVYSVSMDEAVRRNDEYNEILTRALPKLEKLGGWDALLQKVEDSKGNSYRTGNLVFWYSQKYQDEVKTRREQTKALVDRITRSNSIPEAVKKNKIQTAWKTYYNRLNKDTIHLDIRKLLYDDVYMPEVEIDGVSGREVFTDEQLEQYHNELKSALGESNYQRLIDYIKIKKEKFISEFLEIKLQSGTEVTMTLDDAKNTYFFAEETERGVIGYTEEEYNEMKAWEYKYSPYFKSQFLSDTRKTPFTFNGETIVPEDRFVLSAPRKFYPDGKLTGIYDPQMDIIEGDQDVVDLYNYIFKTLAELRHYIPHYMLEGTSVNTIPFAHKQFNETFSETPVTGKASAALRVFKETIRGKIQEEKQTESNLRVNRINFIRSNKAEVEREVKLRLERIEQERMLNGGLLGRVERTHLYKDLKKQVVDELFLKNQSQDLGKVIKWYTAMILQYQEKARYLDTLSVVEEYLKREFGEQQVQQKRTLSERIKNFTKGVPQTDTPNSELSNLINSVSETMDVFEGRSKHMSDERKWVISTKIKESGSKKSIFKPFSTDARFGILQRIGLTKKERDEYKEVLKYIEELQSSYRDGNITQEYYQTRIENLQALKDKFDTAGISIVAIGDSLLRYTQLLLLGWNFGSLFPNRWIGMYQNISKASENTSFSLGAYFKAFKAVSGTKAKLQFVPAAALSIVGGIYGLSLVGAMAGWVAGNIIGKAIHTAYQKSTGGAGNKVDNLMSALDILKKSQDELYRTTHKFNSPQEWHSDISNPYNIINAAETLNQSEILVALMYSVPITDKGGNVRTLYDAYNNEGTWNYEEFDDNADWNMDHGLRSASKMLELKLETDHIITIYHGNYDPNKTIRVKRRVLGRLISQFRTWLYENMSQYTESERKDYLTINRSTDEDHVIRRGKLGTLREEYKSIPKLLLAATGLKKLNPGTMTQVNFQNMNAITNMLRIYGSVWVMILALSAMFADFDDDEKKAARYALNRLRRWSADMDLYLLAFVDYNKIIRNSESLIPALVTIGRIQEFFKSTFSTLTGDPYNKDKELRMVKDGVKLIPYGSAAYGTAKQAEKEFK